jgi:hypothetical protein
MAEQKAVWAAGHASSTASAAKTRAEITALRAAEEAEEHRSRLTDRVALKQALKPSDPATDRVQVGSLAPRPPLTRAEINAAVARAEGRSKQANQGQPE